MPARVCHFGPCMVDALAALLASLARSSAEIVGTLTGTWIYAGQARLELVSLAKIGSWYLLLFAPFVTVTIVLRGALNAAPHTAPRSHHSA